MARPKKNKTAKPAVTSSNGASNPDEKQKKLQEALASIRKAHGDEALMRLGDSQSMQKKVECISTQCLSLDCALGIGGLPRGRIIEIIGVESSGKTSLALHVVAQAQKEGGTAAFVDAEHALDVKYAANLGVNTGDLLVSQPDCGEQALEIVDALVRSSSVDVVVVDSVAALVPRTELEGEMGQSHVGIQARLMSQALRKLAAVASKTNTMVIFINQIREKVGVMFGSNETTPGGRALKFYSSVRLDIRRIGAIKDGDKHIGNRTRVKVVKNKVAPPFNESEFDIIYGEGVSYLGDLIDMAVSKKLIDKSGAWYSFNSQRIGQGRMNAIEYLKSSQDMVDELDESLRKILFDKGETQLQSEKIEEMEPEEEAEEEVMVPEDE